MKSVFIGLLLLWSYALYGADSFPSPFTAHYKVYADGLPVGKGTRTLSFRQNGELQFDSIAETTGLISFFKHIRIEERTVFTQVGGKIRPKEYSYHQTGSKPRLTTISFDWSKKVAKNTFKDQTQEILLDEGTLDKLLYQVVLMQELEQGKRQLNYKIADKGKISTYIPTFIGEVHVKTGIGNLKTLKYQRVSSNKKRPTTLWCAPSLHYLPVQVEHVETDGDVFSMVLQSVQGLD